MIVESGPGAPGSATTGPKQNDSTSIITDCGSALKKHRVIRALLAGPLHRFQAEKFPVSDHALPSTVSELRKDGLEIIAKRITVPGYGGQAAHLAEYHLAPESRQKALQIIGAGR